MLPRPWFDILLLQSMQVQKSDVGLNLGSEVGSQFEIQIQISVRCLLSRSDVGSSFGLGPGSNVKIGSRVGNRVAVKTIMLYRVCVGQSITLTFKR